MNETSEDTPQEQADVTHELKGVFQEMSTPVLTNTIDCKSPDDKEPPKIYDVKCMHIKQVWVLVVADYANYCLKSFSNNLRVSRLNLPSVPYRIAKLEDNAIAVTLPGSSQIANVKVSPELSFDSYIATSKRYIGLTALTPSTLAASSAHHFCVDVLDMSGNLLHSITPIQNEQRLLRYPIFLCTRRDGNILVSDCGSKSVLCLTPHGDIVFNYSPVGDRKLEWPTGITVIENGDILVSDSGGHKVIQLSESGQFVRAVLTERDGLNTPSSIDFSERTNMYVTRSYSSLQMFTC